MGILLNQINLETKWLQSLFPLCPRTLSSSTTVSSRSLRINSTRSSRPPATPSRAPGPDFSAKPSRVRISPRSSPTLALHPLPPLLLVPPVPPLLLPLRRRRQRLRRTSTWATSSVAVMTTIEQIDQNSLQTISCSVVGR